MSVILTSSDDGYEAIRGYWQHENFPARFNYQRYQWMTVLDSSGAETFVRSEVLPTYGGNVHTDRPAVPGVSGPTARIF